MPRSLTIVEDPTRTVPRFVVAVRHPTMRRYLCDLIEQHCRCWLATTSPEPVALRAAMAELQPDALIVEAATLSGATRALAGTTTHVVVIGPTPDDAYRDAALDAGADAWIARDDVATALLPALEHIRCSAGCRCGCHDHTRPEEVAP